MFFYAVAGTMTHLIILVSYIIYILRPSSYFTENGHRYCTVSDIPERGFEIATLST